MGLVLGFWGGVREVKRLPKREGEPNASAKQISFSYLLIWLLGGEGVLSQSLFCYISVDLFM